MLATAAPACTIYTYIYIYLLFNRVAPGVFGSGIQELDAVTHTHMYMCIEYREYLLYIHMHRGSMHVHAEIQIDHGVYTRIHV